MRYKAYIFDFDGTLVHSNALKREAFFQLSDEIVRHRDVVENVLSLIPEKSRFEIIGKIYEAIEEKTGVRYSDGAINTAIEKYSSLVHAGVLACPEFEGATLLLEHLSKVKKRVYISSNTPEEPLGELIKGRGWKDLVDKYFGFPKQKSETVKLILETDGLDASDVIVIGDGKSDEVSADENDCSFYKIVDEMSLWEFYSRIRTADIYV